jgi:hypothetical protein
MILRGKQWMKLQTQVMRDEVENMHQRALVTHTCNSSFSGGRDQEDRGLKPGHNSSRDPISKILNTKKSGGVAQGVGPEFKPQYCKKSVYIYIYTSEEVRMQRGMLRVASRGNKLYNIVMKMEEVCQR